MTRLPLGFHSHVANIGVKDDTDDFVVIAAERAVPVAGVFTRSRFAGPSVTLSRAQIADGQAHAVVVISKNANVATGPDWPLGRRRDRPARRRSARVRTDRRRRHLDRRHRPPLPHRPDPLRHRRAP
jgi:N-acetylglutamate synthase/N-acetylornithine aminotransferase